MRNRDLAIHFEVFGEGNPETILLVHGLGDSSRTFLQTARDLSGGYRVIVPDQRDHGATPALGEDYSTKRLAADIEDLLLSSNVGKVHLVGHSLGGRVAIRYAEIHPERVSTLTIEDVFVQPAEGVTPVDPARVKVIDEAFPDHFDGREQAIRSIEAIFGNDADYITHKHLRRSADGTWSLNFRPKVNYLFYRQTMAEDLSSAFRSVRAPILVMSADPEAGGQVTEASLNHMRELRPGISLQLFAGSGHVIHRERPLEFETALQRFIQRNTR